MRQRGFTLIEIIVGIVTLGIALVVLSTLLFPQAPRSAEPLLQARASALGQMFINEIMGKAFDESSDMSGGYSRCSDSATCTASGALGAEEPTRSSYDDVDDFNGLSTQAGDEIDDVLLQGGLNERFQNFSFAISVAYSNDTGEAQSVITRFKRIDVTITAPNQQTFRFTAIKGDY
ncbi:MAG: agglutinin biogenesis protein MshD [Idiomarina sp.]|uniref:type IV pilus modification PilV family protein n=1 Tax=Idiomarina sp. TaxID=1874361 RepID=UPI000C559CF3|nr:prepilin-type N-terminal cleavage/methylation domain-containing protein [Idiomarina sp.]MBT42116.1 agglutinin biogenesis protein MshD [Idiomarina sp.]